jgi:hypothetical protein
MQATRPIYRPFPGHDVWQRSVGRQLTFLRSTLQIETIEIEGYVIPITSGTLRTVDTPLGSRWQADLLLPAVEALPRTDKAFRVTFRTRPGLFAEARVLRGMGVVAGRATSAVRLESVGDDAAWATD